MTRREENVRTDDIAGARAPERDEDVPVAREAEQAEHADAGGERASAVRHEELTPLFDEAEAAQLRSRWEELQTRFVDDPRETVEEADGLVADLMQRLAEMFADERRALEAQWSAGDDVSTEDLRVALRRYRSFLERLLSA